MAKTSFALLVLLLSFSSMNLVKCFDEDFFESIFDLFGLGSSEEDLSFEDKNVTINCKNCSVSVNGEVVGKGPTTTVPTQTPATMKPSTEPAMTPATTPTPTSVTMPSSDSTTMSSPESTVTSDPGARKGSKKPRSLQHEQ